VSLTPSVFDAVEGVASAVLAFSAPLVSSTPFFETVKGVSFTSSTLAFSPAGSLPSLVTTLVELE